MIKLPADPAANLERVLLSTLNILDRIQTIHTELGTSPQPDGALESELTSLVRHRKKLHKKVGKAMISALAAGVHVSLSLLEEAEEFEELAEIEVPEPERSSEPVEPLEFEESSPEPEENYTLVNVVKPATRPISNGAPSPHFQPPKAMAASQSSLKALAANGFGQTFQDLPRTTPTRVLIGQLPKPRLLNTILQAEKLIEEIATCADHCNQWDQQSKHAQQAFLGLLSSLIRYLDEEFDWRGPAPSNRALRQAFSRLTVFSRNKQPGWVSSMSLKYPPKTGSWLSDAHYWWNELQSQVGEGQAIVGSKEALRDLKHLLEEGGEDTLLEKAIENVLQAGISQSNTELVTLLTPYQSRIRSFHGLKTLKSALKDKLRDQEDFEEVQDEASPIPEAWPFWHTTKRKKAIILGGDPRPQSKARILKAFDFESLDWESTDIRRVEALDRRIRRGSVDMVIVIKSLVSHSHTGKLQPACADSEAHFVLVNNSYGVSAIRRAIEKALR